MKWTAAVLLALATLLASSAAYAQPSDARQRASAHFRRGVALFEEGDREAALVEFERAYEAYPTYAVLYNVGQTALALRRYVEALRALERYLEEGGSSVPPERLADVQSMIDTLRTRTAHLSITVNIEGAEIRVDGNSIGTSPLEDAIVVDVGRHALFVQAPGHDPFEREIVIAGGDSDTVEVTLVATAERVVRVIGANVVAEDTTLQSLAIAGFVLTGLCAAGAITTAVLGFEERDQLLILLDQIPANVEEVEATRGRAFNFGLAADILTGAGVALGIASIVLIVMDASDSTEDEAPATEVGVRAAPGGFALVF